ncbi:Type II inositol 1,4,5-trisphosphate 5-phosphatase [Larimichthys crocea]|uniref:Uncharacterized protein n=1 Tax=Larimichthys crocea TaxID=215358 RepID=A0ACD3QU97_LARCR|nr:Type II inositol 1,4,5-trisphosphate 5-phosphatase [Larimichthys crocea]
MGATTIQSSTMTSSNTATTAMSTSQAPTTTISSGSTGTATTQSMSTSSGGTAMTSTTQSITTTATPGGTASITSTQSPTATSTSAGMVTTMTQSPTTTSGGIVTTTTPSPTSTSGGSASSASTQPPTTTSTSGGIVTTTTTSPTSTSGGSASITPTQSPTATSSSGGIATTTTQSPTTTSGGSASSASTQPPTTTSTSGGIVTTTPSPTSTSGGSASTASTQPPTTTSTSGGTASITPTQSPTATSNSGGIATATTQSPTSTSGGTASTTSTQPPTTSTTSGGIVTTTTQSPTTTSTSGGTVIPTQSPTTTSGGSATTTQSGISTTATASSTPSNPISATNSGTASAPSTVASTARTQSTISSMTSGSGSSTSMMSTNQTSNSTGGMNGTTTTNNTSMSMISCPSFTCNYSDCYTMYNNENTSCTTGGYCQLIRQTDMCYTVGCSASCVDRCVNASQSNCSVSCCNSTGCLNGSFASMMMTTTTVISTMTTTTTQATTTTTTTTTSPKTDATSATSANNVRTDSCMCEGKNAIKVNATVQLAIKVLDLWKHALLHSHTVSAWQIWVQPAAEEKEDEHLDRKGNNVGLHVAPEASLLLLLYTWRSHERGINYSQLPPCYFRCGKQSRLLGLVESTKEHAIFIYTHRRMAITADDVSLEDIIPISLDFAVVEVSSPEELAVVGGDTRVRVSYQEDEIELRLPFGSHSRLFLSEVNRAWSDVCKSPTQVPKFEWTNKYHKPTKGQGVVKQALSPLNTTITKLSQHRKTEKSSDKRGNLEKEKGSNSATQKSKAYPSPESQGIPSREDRDDMVRSSSHTPSNKAQILAMPQFGLRDNLIRCELLKNEDLYTYLEDFSFFLGTYNVNGQTPKESLRPWLSCTLNPPDMYCVGFQELDLSKEAFFFNDTPKELEWTKAVSEALHPDAKYALVKLVRLVGIMLIFYVKKQHAEFISDVEAETVGTGIMGRMGNKGAVAIRFRFHNSDICVVNSHLAAHIEEYERRNQDYKDICGRLQFRQLDPTQPPLTIMKHDVILWIGDLNYRISDLDVDNVKELISKNEFETLHNYDQLKRQIDEEAVFVGFVEGEINFQPTYKYDTGSDKWDTSEKCRVPAWCDRILWRGKNIKQQHYQSHMALKTSDHKPVSSLLVTGIKRVNSEDYKKTFEEIVRNIDKMENECIPSVTLAKQEFHFKDVKYMQHQAETLSLFNDGQVPCQFEFIQEPN